MKALHSRFKEMDSGNPFDLKGILTLYSNHCLSKFLFLCLVSEQLFITSVPLNQTYSQDQSILYLQYYHLLFNAIEPHSQFCLLFSNSLQEIPVNLDFFCLLHLALFQTKCCIKCISVSANYYSKLPKSEMSFRVRGIVSCLFVVLFHLQINVRYFLL